MLGFIFGLTLVVSQGTGGASPPDSVEAHVYYLTESLEPTKIDTLVVPAKAEISVNSPLVGVEVRYGGASYFSQPVKPEDTVRLTVYEPGARPEDIKVESYSAAFMSQGDTVMVGEILTLSNPTDRAFSGQLLFALPLPQNVVQFQYMGSQEEYWLSDAKDTVYLAPTVIPGSGQRVALSYLLPMPFTINRSFPVAPDSISFLADDSVSLRAKGLTKVGVQSLGGLPMVLWAFREPTASFSIRVERPRGFPPWAKSGLLALGVLVVLGVAWWWIGLKGKRRRLLAELGELELARERGELSEEEYKERRSELLARLSGEEE